jgi:sucrose phosphorylase
MNLMQILHDLYGDEAHTIYQEITSLIESERISKEASWLSEKDVMLITYGDSIIKEGEMPLQTLHTFLNNHLKHEITNVHLLPMFPYTSDDGFSVVDYMKINPDLGDWHHINELSKDYDLMFDGVINHISKESDWFKGYLNGEKDYENFFITCDPHIDYSKVTRPRALPLYYAYRTKDNMTYIWATFSEDQVDLNYQNPRVLLAILKVMIYYAKQGARFIRLDAIGFLWKQIGTSCIHLAQTHKLIQIMRYVIDQTVPGTLLISETNVPHLENISYFGQNDEEASLVYQFPLPPLVLYTFIEEDTTKLSSWLKSLDDTPLHKKNTYFNFLASHDGIGVRPVEGILTEDDKKNMIDHVIHAGGRISYKNNTDGTKSPYEMNISYVDAITSNTDDDLKVRKFIASQAILVLLKGIPGIYIHSLLGTHNDLDGVLSSGINRRINRKKLNVVDLEQALSDSTSFESNILSSYKALIKVRMSDMSFSPDADQEVIDEHHHLFVMRRHHSSLDYNLIVFINVSKYIVQTTSTYQGEFFDTHETISGLIELKPFEYRILKVKS